MQLTTSTTSTPTLRWSASTWTKSRSNYQSEPIYTSIVTPNNPSMVSIRRRPVKRNEQRNTRIKHIISIKKNSNLGSGSYGDVFETVNGKAVKRCSITNEGINNLLELNIMYYVNHPNINKATFIQIHNEYILIEQDKANYDLKSYLRSEESSKSEYLDIWYQICLGVYYLHSKNIIHADLKPTNILLFIDSNGKIRVKITDFGMSKLYIGDKLTCKYGTPTFIAPEYYIDKEWDKKTDIWSLGLILYILFNDRNIFPVQDTAKAYISAFNQFCSLTEQDSLHLDITKKIIVRNISYNPKSKYIDHILQMLKVDPDERPDIEDIINMDIFDSMEDKPKYEQSKYLTRDDILRRIKFRIYDNKPETQEMLVNKIFNTHNKDETVNVEDEKDISKLLKFNYIPIRG